LLSFPLLILFTPTIMFLFAAIWRVHVTPNNTKTDSSSELMRPMCKINQRLLFAVSNIATPAVT
jgi:hypothetical protein